MITWKPPGKLAPAATSIAEVSPKQVIPAGQVPTALVPSETETPIRFAGATTLVACGFVSLLTDWLLPTVRFPLLM
jgi:hypothetical protein